jgi:hypothetical protein
MVVHHGEVGETLKFKMQTTKMNKKGSYSKCVLILSDLALYILNTKRKIQQKFIHQEIYKLFKSEGRVLVKTKRGDLVLQVPFDFCRMLEMVYKKIMCRDLTVIEKDSSEITELVENLL